MLAKFASRAVRFPPDRVLGIPRWKPSECAAWGGQRSLFDRPRRSSVKQRSFMVWNHTEPGTFPACSKPSRPFRNALW